MNTTSTTVPKNIVPAAPKRKPTNRGLPKAVFLFLSRKLPILMAHLVKTVKDILSCVPLLSLYITFAGLAWYFIPWGEDTPLMVCSLISASISHVCVVMTVLFYEVHVDKWIDEIKRLSKEKL